MSTKPVVAYAVTLVCLAGAVPLRLYPIGLGRGWRRAEVHKAAVMLLIGALSVFLSWFAFLLYDRPAVDSLFKVVSATATVGLSCGS